MKRRTLWLIVGIAGGTAALIGSGLGVLVLALGLVSDGRLTPGSTLPAGALVALALGLGIPASREGWAAWRGQATRPFAPKSFRWMVLLLASSIGLGWLITTMPLLPALLLPPVHAVAMALPPLILLWVTGSALAGKGGSWRDVVASLGGGGLLGTVLSFAAEGVLVVVLVAVIALVLLAQPGGAERIAALVERIQDAASLEDTAALVRLLLTPAAALVAVFVLGLAVPMIEEGLKTLAVGAVGGWVRPSPARALLWGVASGAGFAIAENLLNGALGGGEAWVAAAVTRIGASVMHCFTGGLVGWGWGQLWTERRPSRLLGSLAVAVVLHGTWNTVAVGTVLLGGVVEVHAVPSEWQVVGRAGMVVLGGLLGLLALALAIALPIAARQLVAAERSRSGDSSQQNPPRVQQDRRPPDDAVASA